MKKTTIKILNSKSIMDCEDDEEIEKHTEEILNVLDKITELNDFHCALICKYQDEYHKRFEAKIKDCYLSEVLEELEYFDIKNGVDLCIDKDGFLVFMIYGQTYEYNDNDYIITMAMKILPIDENKNFIDVSEVIYFDGRPKVSKQQFEYACIS